MLCLQVVLHTPTHHAPRAHRLHPVLLMAIIALLTTLVVHLR
jgi:hypothetical protein